MSAESFSCGNISHVVKSTVSGDMWSLDDDAVAKKCIELASSSPAGVEVFDYNGGVGRLSPPDEKTAKKRVPGIVEYFMERVTVITLTFMGLDCMMTCHPRHLSAALDSFASEIRQQTSGVDYLPDFKDKVDNDEGDNDEDDDDYSDDDDETDDVDTDEGDTDDDDTDEEECSEDGPIFGQEHADYAADATPLFDELFPPVLSDAKALTHKQVTNIWKSTMISECNADLPVSGEKCWKLVERALNAYVATSLLEPKLEPKTLDDALAKVDEKEGGKKRKASITLENAAKKASI